MKDSFKKVIGEFDRIIVEKEFTSESVYLHMDVGNGVERVTMIFRSEEALRDLQYALHRLLEG